jgi:membrane-associated protease RseP (regulator of RpoE activity)
MPEKLKTYILQFFLFVLTVLSTTQAGTFLIGLPHGNPDFAHGLLFSIPFLTFLTVHEFGHYITARIHKVKVSLPYYIPVPFFGIIGTMGAFIRIKSMPRSKKEFFDIGISGPLAGFVIGLGLIVYGLTHLPPADYIYQIHPEYREEGYAQRLKEEKKGEGIMMGVGSNLLIELLEEVLVEDKTLLPDEYELMHYPFLFAGFLSLFFTALNLLPLGQLDGGHILFGLVGGKYHKIVSDYVYLGLIYAGGLGIWKWEFQEGFMPLASFNDFIIFAPIYLFFLYSVFLRKFRESQTTNFLIAIILFIAQYATVEIFPDVKGFITYLIFALIIGRMFGTAHPPVVFEESLSKGRKFLGWITLGIFILCFSFQPLWFD